MSQTLPSLSIFIKILPPLPLTFTHNFYVALPMLASVYLWKKNVFWIFLSQLILYTFYCILNLNFHISVHQRLF